MTTHNLMRKRLLAQVGLYDRTEYSTVARGQTGGGEFFARMEARVVMGYYRYGSRYSQRIGAYNLLAEAKNRIDRYLADPNLEHLVDAANMLMLEYIRPDTHGAYFQAIDDNPEHSQERCR